MRMPWKKSNDLQLDLLDADATADAVVSVASPPHQIAAGVCAGQPLIVEAARLYVGLNNPRTEVPEADVEELAEDVLQHGILQPIVVHPADADGRHRIHFGTKWLRAAVRAGLLEVPVVVRDAPADPYAQVAENQKRHGLTPLDLARFIKGQADAGDSNAAISKRLGMNLTTVAHHLALLALPPELDEALKSGRCTSPRTLHELSQLHDEQPEKVHALMAGDVEITRAAVSALRTKRTAAEDGTTRTVPFNKLIAQANSACDRLERALTRIEPTTSHKDALPELVALRVRIADLTERWLQGSDCQTHTQTGH